MLWMGWIAADCYSRDRVSSKGLNPTPFEQLIFSQYMLELPSYAHTQPRKMLNPESLSS